MNKRVAKKPKISSIGLLCLILYFVSLVYTILGGIAGWMIEHSIIDVFNSITLGGILIGLLAVIISGVFGGFKRNFRN